MKKAYFLSDLHLGASYHENDKDLQRGVVRFLDKIREDAEEIYLLGDILDYWFEYRYVVPKGYVRLFGKLAELADAGIKITWIIGNHDIWIFDYLPDELGIDVVDGVLEKEILGVPFSLQHGDAIGGEWKFRFIRSLFRNKFCQKLYSGIHPRWTVGFAHAWSKQNRLYKQKNGMGNRNPIEDIRRWCEEQIKAGNRARYFVFGHLHLTYDESLGDDRRLIVVPDWPAWKTYGVFDGERFKLCSFD